MQTLSFQNLDIPLAYITAVSYQKNARVSTNSAGFGRFMGFEPSEMSIRVAIDGARCSLTGEQFRDVLSRFLALSPQKDSEPTQVVLGGHILYPSLLYRLTSINKTVASGHNGFPYAAEFDLSLSGVACTKAETGRRALVFTRDDIIELPSITIKCKGKEYVVGSETTVSQLIIKPLSCDIGLLIGDDSAIVKDSSWLTAVVDNNAEVVIEGYGRFYIVQANLVQGELSMTGSKFAPSSARVKTQTFIEQPISTVISQISGTYKGNLDGQIDYYLMRSTPIEALRSLQESAGFLINSEDDGVSYWWIPRAFNPTIEFDLYVEEDEQTEPISGFIWDDGIIEIKAGEFESSASLRVHSVFASNSGDWAAHCLEYNKYMQNKIIVNVPVDNRIKHHSCFTIYKNTVAIKVMVEDYTIDFITNNMELELHYIAR